MSDWTGPGLYRIESGIKRTCRVALTGGRKADNTPVVTWNNDPNHNDIMAITLAGIGTTGRNEYHIINNNSGTFLTYPDGAPEGKQLTGNVLSPSDKRTRWNIIPLRNGSGKYWVTPVADSGMFLNINSGKTDNNVEVWLYKDGQHPSCQWYLTHAVERTEFFDFPDIGKGN